MGVGFDTWPCCGGVGQGQRGWCSFLGCGVRGEGELGCLSAAPGHCCAAHSSACLVRSFGCLKHLSNTLGTAH